MVPSIYVVFLEHLALNPNKFNHPFFTFIQFSTLYERQRGAASKSMIKRDDTTLCIGAWVGDFSVVGNEVYLV